MVIKFRNNISNIQVTLVVYQIRLEIEAEGLRMKVEVSRVVKTPNKVGKRKNKKRTPLNKCIAKDKEVGIATLTINL